MAAKGAVADKYVNKAVITCTESAANTLTFAKLETGVPLFEKMAWVIHKIEYAISAAAFGYFNASVDYLNMALTTTDTLTSLSETQSAVINFKRLARIDIGTAASGFFIWTYPLCESDFTNFPGGGIIVPPNPLFLGVQGNSLTTAVTVSAIIRYTSLPLKPDEYWELVESTRILSS